MPTSNQASPTDIEVRTIGDLIKETRDLSAEQVQQILEHQRAHGVRFGEAAIALGFATNEDVLLALSQQFHYPYADAERRKASPELVALNQPFGQQAEAFRSLRSQLSQRVYVDGQPTVRLRRAIAVTSPAPRDGKTFFSANLAVTFAQLGGRTLVLDCDLRGPNLHEVFAVDNSYGLSGLLSRRKSTSPNQSGGGGAIKVVPGVPNLYILPVGIQPPNPLELLEGPAFGALLMELVNKFDHVIVDTPAASYGSDAVVLGARCGLALVVARKNVSRVSQLQDLTTMLTNANATIAGVVMNEF